MEKRIICPVCGKTMFGQRCDYDICRFCGWENDGYYEPGGANELSLDEYKERYRKCVELNPDYYWRRDGVPIYS